MKRKCVAIAMALCILLVCCFSLSACSSEGVLQFKLNEDGESYRVTKFSGTSENIDIEVPALYHNKPITKIDDFVFASKEYIKSISLSEKIEEIGEMAFAGSQQLEKITVDEKSTHFTDLEGVLFNKDVSILLKFPSKWKGIEFDEQSGNGVVYKIPKSVIKIQGCAFYKALSIVELILPPGVKEIGESALLRCTNMKNINLPEGLQKIEKDAFLYCQGLEKIVIPASVTEIGDYAFSYANNLKGIYMKRAEKDAGEMKLGKNWIAHKKDEIKDNVTVVWSYEEGENE